MPAFTVGDKVDVEAVAATYLQWVFDNIDHFVNVRKVGLQYVNDAVVKPLNQLQLTRRGTPPKQLTPEELRGEGEGDDSDWEFGG